MERNTQFSTPLPGMTITSGLSGFSLLSRVSAASGETLAAEINLKNAAPYLGLEAMAQAGAYHVRFLCRFEKQAVLLMIRHCRLPEDEILNGRFELTGQLRSRSASVFDYELSAGIDGETLLEGTFVFTAVAYDLELREDILRPFYEKKWETLRSV